MQITGETIGEVRAVSDMHQRKAEMARQADAFIALPGMSRSSFNQRFSKFAWILVVCMHAHFKRLTIFAYILTISRRWIWHSRRTARGYYMGSTWNSPQTRKIEN